MRQRLNIICARIESEDDDRFYGDVKDDSICAERFNARPSSVINFIQSNIKSRDIKTCVLKFRVLKRDRD